MSKTDRRSSTTSDVSSASMNGDFSSHSVQELFEKFSIQEIQKLQRNYQQQVSQSKDALQSLVSNKYRDLIAITDEIAETYTLTSDLEASLSELAFRKGKFISFNTPNNFSQLQSSILTNEVDELRTSQRSSVMNQVIYDKILRFDLAINGESLVHTSNYIYFAKVFHITQAVFAKDLASKKSLQVSLQGMKDNFQQMLEAQLASFNLSSTSLYTSDSDINRPSHHLNASSILLKTQPNILEDTEFDLEEIVDEPLASHQDSDYEDSLPEQYNKNTLSIVNYLVAYVILNGSGSSAYTIGSTLIRLLQLRYQFLKNLLDEVLTNVNSTNISHVNFLSVFKFIENTLGYSKSYFSKHDANNIFIEQLKSATHKWNSDKLLATNGWVQDTVYFNTNAFDITLPQSSVDEMNRYHQKFITLIYDFYHNLANSSSIGKNIGDVSVQFWLFSSFVTGFRRLDSFCSNNGFESHLFKLLSTSDSHPIVQGLDETIGKISSLHELHLDQLTSDTGIVANITSSLDSNDSLDQFNLFSNDLVSLIDNDLSKYFDLIKQASFDKSYSFDPNDSLKQITRWFENAIKFDSQLRIEPYDVSEKSSAYLSRIVHYISKSTSSSSPTQWGKFSKALVADKFEKVRYLSTEHFWTSLAKFIDQLQGILQKQIEKQDVSNVYYLSTIVSILKDETKKVEEANSDSVIKSLDSLNSKVFEFILDVVPQRKDDSITFYDQFEAIIDRVLNSESAEDDLISSVSFKLTSLISHIASEFLNPSSSSHEADYKSGLIFTKHHEGTNFASFKNEWIQSELIEKRIISKLKDVQTTNEVIDALYSGIVFLKCLVDPKAKLGLGDLSDFYNGDVDESHIDAIRDGVVDAYRSSMDTYFPLNA